MVGLWTRGDKNKRRDAATSYIHVHIYDVVAEVYIYCSNVFGRDRRRVVGVRDAFRPGLMARIVKRFFNAIAYLCINVY